MGCFANTAKRGRALDLDDFPPGTLAINVFGSALMGVVIVVLSMRSGTSHELRVFLTTGLIGGFTTWSTFSLDAYSLWERG